jgi:hypothetical protein
MNMGDTSISSDHREVDSAFISYLEQCNPDKATVSVTVDYNTQKDEYLKHNTFCSDVGDFLAQHAKSIKDCVDRQDTMDVIKERIASWLGETAHSARTSEDMHVVYVCTGDIQ